MKQFRVTITGADNSVQPIDLVDIGKRYPFVEWGILVSESRQSTARYPSLAWIQHLQEVARREPMALSLHLCGRWVRQFLLGINELPTGLLDKFQRVQLNFHAERTACNPRAMRQQIIGIGPRQVIFQMDGELGNKHLDSLLEEPETGALVADAAPLFDISGGAGILPDEWPKPIYLRRAFGQDLKPVAFIEHGYAGGLGPDNLAEQLPKIAAAAGTAPFWVDMETRVRSDHDVQFDLIKVERCLQLCKEFVEAQP